MEGMKKDWNIVVVGAGAFGLTTALELALQGYRNITVLDRDVPPVRKEISRLSIEALLTSSSRSLTAPALTSHG